MYGLKVEEHLTSPPLLASQLRFPLTFQASVTGTGAVTATVVMQVSNEEAAYLGTTSNWITLGTITLSGTTTATDGFTTDAPWRYVRAGVTAISGTGATVTSNMGV